MLVFVVPLGGTVGAAVDLGGWAVVALAVQLAGLAAIMSAGALRSEIRLTDDEVIDRRIIGSKRWRWSDVGCLSIGSMGRGSVHLVVCVVGDPSPHRLRGFPLRSLYRAPATEMIDEIRSKGYPIETPEADAHVWWANDARANAR